MFPQSLTFKYIVFTNHHANVQGTWESFPGARKRQESLFSSQNFREKDLLMGKTLMIWISTEYFD